MSCIEEFDPDVEVPGQSSSSVQTRGAMDENGVAWITEHFSKFQRLPAGGFSADWISETAYLDGVTTPTYLEVTNSRSHTIAAHGDHGAMVMAFVQGVSNPGIWAILIDPDDTVNAPVNLNTHFDNNDAYTPAVVKTTDGFCAAYGQKASSDHNVTIRFWTESVGWDAEITAFEQPDYDPGGGAYSEHLRAVDIDYCPFDDSIHCVVDHDYDQSGNDINFIRYKRYGSLTYDTLLSYDVDSAASSGNKYAYEPGIIVDPRDPTHVIIYMNRHWISGSDYIGTFDIFELVDGAWTNTEIHRVTSTSSGVGQTPFTNGNMRWSARFDNNGNLHCFYFDYSTDDSQFYPWYKCRARGESSFSDAVQIGFTGASSRHMAVPKLLNIGNTVRVFWNDNNGAQDRSWWLSAEIPPLEDNNAMLVFDSLPGGSWNKWKGSA